MLLWQQGFWLLRSPVSVDNSEENRMKEYTEYTDEELLEKIIVNNFGSDEFFINKAIGWSLRDYSKTNPAWVRDFIARYHDRMKPLSIREASKYI